MFNIGRELLNILGPKGNKMTTSGIFIFLYIYFDKIISTLLTVIKVTFLKPVNKYHYVLIRFTQTNTKHKHKLVK